MRKKAKEILAILIFMLILSACGAEKPEDTVGNVFRHLQNNELSEIGSYFYTDSKEEGEDILKVQGNDEESDFYSDIMGNVMDELAGQNAQYISCEIMESTVDGDEATVKVKVTYKNAGPIIKLAFNDLLNQSISSAFTSEFFGGGDMMTDEDMAALFLASVEKAKQNAALIDKTDTLEIPCKKTDGGWKISEAEAFPNIYYCNILDSISSLFSELEEEDAPETESSEIPETESSGISAEEEADVNEEFMSFTYWDEESEMTLDLTYLGDDGKGGKTGEFEISISLYDEDTGESDSVTGEGTFTEDADGKGILTLDNGNTGEYDKYWEDDHYVLSINIGSETADLLEAEWAYQNVG